MRLTVFNGSPKPANSNTELMVNKFIEGFENTSGNVCEIYKLNKLAGVNEAIELFKQSDLILLAFPLYYFAMPAGVMKFIEALEPLRGSCFKKKMGFIVQFGFREAIHARALEKYLEKLTTILKCEYLGTVVKGGCNELTRNTESYRSKKVFAGIYDIGKTFGETGEFNKILLDQYSKPETATKLSRIMMKFTVKLTNRFYWDVALKKNGVFNESFAQPYKVISNS